MLNKNPIFDGNTLAWFPRPSEVQAVADSRGGGGTAPLPKIVLRHAVAGTENVQLASLNYELFGISWDFST